MTDDIKHLPAKAASVGAAWMGGMTWGEFASMLAAIYTGLLMIEWVWKRIGKPLAQRRGWIAGPRREFLDSTGAAPLGDK
jgi:hypothetical protein